MTIGEQIYATIEKHCGDLDNVTLRGVTKQSLINMKEGKAMPTIPLLKKIFDANGIPAELVLTIKADGKTEKKKFRI